jgi:hypothetical protein
MMEDGLKIFYFFLSSVSQDTSAYSSFLRREYGPTVLTSSLGGTKFKLITTDKLS